MIRSTACALVLAVALPAEAAYATFPGSNGRIAVVSDDSPHLLATVDEQGRKLQPLGRSYVNGSASWSPDGMAIAWAGPQGVVYAENADGSGARRVTNGWAPSWSPDGARLAVTREDGIYTMAADGTDARLLVPGGSAPKWSPDGRRIAFQSLRGISTVVVDGGATTPLAVGGTFACPTAVVPVIDYGATWSPGGSALAFGSFFACGLAFHGSISTVNRDGSNLQTVASGGAADNGAYSPIWSPDGTRIVFELDQARDPCCSLVTVDAAGGVTTLTRRELVPLDWQPRCTVRGTARGDVLRGGTGDDLVCGLGGNDRISGGLGSDRLFGEGGNDRIGAADGTFDVVGCGPGVDSVTADRVDLVGRDCERVVRR